MAVNRKAKLLVGDSRQSKPHPLFSDPGTVVEVINGTQVYDHNGVGGDAWRDIAAGVDTELTCRNCGHKVTVGPD